MKLLKVLLILRIWGLPALLAVVLFLGQMAGLGSDLVSREPILRLDSISAIGLCWALILLGFTACNKPVVTIWNRLTPVPDKETQIESDFIHALSAVLGLSLILFVFFAVSPANLPAMFGYILLASLPGFIIGYALSSCIRTLALSIEPEDGPMVEIKEHVVTPALEEKYFWRRGLSFLYAAITFNILVGFTILGIVYLKSQSAADGHLIKVSFLNECTIVTLITMTVFGETAFRMGQRILRLLQISLVKVRYQNALAYFTGFSVILVLIVPLTVGALWLSQDASLLSTYSYAVAYLIVTICFAIASIVFAWTHGEYPDDADTDIPKVFV